MNCVNFIFGCNVNLPVVIIMPPPAPRICSKENCPSQNISPNHTWHCQYCKKPIHLLCYCIDKDPEEIFVIDNVVMICDECLRDVKDFSSPKRKQPNQQVMSMIQQTIDPQNHTLQLPRTVPNTATPPKTLNAKQNQPFQAAIESLVKKVETQTVTIAALKTSVELMNSTIIDQRQTIEQSITSNTENLSSIKKTLNETPSVVQLAIKQSYANVLKDTGIRSNETPKSSKRAMNKTPNESKSSKSPSIIKPVVTRTSEKVIGKPLSPNKIGRKAMWISKLHRDTTEDELRIYIKEFVGLSAADQCQIRKLVKKDRPMSSYSFVSFKISCPETMFTTLIDAAKWPSYCNIREFDMDKQTSTGFKLNLGVSKSTDAVSKNLENAQTVQSPNVSMETSQPQTMDTSHISQAIH